MIKIHQWMRKNHLKKLIINGRKYRFKLFLVKIKGLFVSKRLSKKKHKIYKDELL